MSRKANRLKSLRKKASAARKEAGLVSNRGYRDLVEAKKRHDVTLKELGDYRLRVANLNREVSLLTKMVAESKNLEAFRVDVANSRPFRNDPIYNVSVAFDVRSLQIGFSYGFRNDVYDLSSKVRFLVEELRYKIERKVVEELTKDGVIGQYSATGS